MDDMDEVNDLNMFWNILICYSYNNSINYTLRI